MINANSSSFFVYQEECAILPVEDMIYDFVCVVVVVSFTNLLEVCIYNFVCVVHVHKKYNFVLVFVGCVDACVCLFG